MGSIKKICIENGLKMSKAQRESFGILVREEYKKTGLPKPEKIEETVIIKVRDYPAEFEPKLIELAKNFLEEHQKTYHPKKDKNKVPISVKEAKDKSFAAKLKEGEQKERTDNIELLLERKFGVQSPKPKRPRIKK